MPSSTKRNAENLKPAPWPESTGLNIKYRIRSPKMIVARCRSCSKQGPGWWENCTHNPYHTHQVQQTPDGGVLLDDAGREVRRWVPNSWQVPLSIRVDSGLGVERALGMGSKWPEEVQPVDPETGEPDLRFTGYAPMCEFQNCYKPFPKYKARHAWQEGPKFAIPASRYSGLYCSERHAKVSQRKDSALAEIMQPYGLSISETVGEPEFVG